MNTNKEHKIEEFAKEYYNKVLEKPNQVLEVFNDFFGEENVDMQVMGLSTFCNFIQCLNIKSYCNSVSNINLPDLDDDTLDIVLDKIKKDNYEVFKPSLRSSLKPIILVHFPKVRIENEYNQFVDITHLYARITINIDGEMIGGFRLNRSEYPVSHFISNYMHSHVRCIPKSNFTQFQEPCLGQGPIRGTITSLNTTFDVDTWGLFCLELDKYVATESVFGGPYHRMDRIGGTNLSKISFLEFEIINVCTIPLYPIRYKDFITNLILSKKLKFNYCNNSYSLGMSLTEWVIFISNEFIAWFNNEYNKDKSIGTFQSLANHNILKEGIIKNNCIYYIIENAISLNEYQNSIICTFKGQDVKLNIINDNENSNEIHYTLLNVHIALYTLNIIIKVLNYKYGRSKTENNTINTKTRYLC